MATAQSPLSLSPLLLERDEAAWGRFWTAAYPLLVRHFARKLRHYRHEAPDLASATMERLYARAPHLTNTITLTYLWATARSVYVDYVRGHARHPWLPLEVCRRTTPPPSEAGVLAAQAMALLAARHPGYALVLRLRYIEDWGYPRIAAHLGTTEGALHNQVWRALRLARALLEQGV